ncbi:hypothetical protein WJX72_002639 [[Myrmecia] bisecta]|uniref:DUF819 family protein n=1 Tax=[Myrmecia] bisecta TaxID=41462 RepID=A0AAW1Q1B1_9CHLO
MHQRSLSSCHVGWLLWTLLALCAAGGQLIERQTPVGRYVSAPLLSLLLALLLSATNVIPITSAVYDIIWTYIMPLAAALYLLESDLREVVSTAGATLVAFIMAMAGTVVGTAVAWWLLGPQLGDGGWKVAAALCASYVGGSVNFAAVSQALGMTPGPLLAACMAADNIAMAAYIAVISTIPVRKEAKAGVVEASAQLAGTGGTPSSETIACALAAAALACALGQWGAAALGYPECGLAIMAVVSSLIASGTAALTKWTGKAGPAAKPFAGAEALAGSLMLLFFATIGAGAGSLQALAGTGWLIAFIGVQLLVHMWLRAF